MPGLFLTTPGTRATLCGERLVITLPAEDEQADAAAATREIPLRDIEHVVLAETAHLTIPALAELLRRAIPVVLTNHSERVLGVCLPPAPHSAARLAQYRAAGDPAQTLALAREWVVAKILNARRTLQRLAANRSAVEADPTLLAMAELAERARTAASLETLRGYEGTAAGRYFELYGSFFPVRAPFERRSRRPPHNAANAVLSYAYTLLCAELECRIHAVGLDPCVGFLHETADGRPALALDMLEPFRAPVADALALDLLTHGTLDPARHFDSRDGGVYLNTEGRKRFFVGYERRLTREYLSEQTGQRTTLRGEMHRQALGLKQTLVDGAPFTPFLMN